MEAVIAAITKAQFQDSQAFYSENCGWLCPLKLLPTNDTWYWKVSYDTIFTQLKLGVHMCCKRIGNGSKAGLITDAVCSFGEVLKQILWSWNNVLIIGWKCALATVVFLLPQRRQDMNIWTFGVFFFFSEKTHTESESIERCNSMLYLAISVCTRLAEFDHKGFWVIMRKDRIMSV